MFVNRGFTKRINELTKPESDEVLDFLWDHIASVSVSVLGRFMSLPLGTKGWALESEDHRSRSRDALDLTAHVPPRRHALVI